MGQQEVLELMKKENRPLTSREMSEMLKANIKSISHSLTLLLKQNVIKIQYYNENRCAPKYSIIKNQN